MLSSAASRRCGANHLPVPQVQRIRSEAANLSLAPLQMKCDSLMARGMDAMRMNMTRSASVGPLALQRGGVHMPCTWMRC
mmetsp:Transcript_5510/g.11516  ORF Transcript_5510/g.11516 Transcript_5510/m.11516 type:complete len:80 (-) Transcript_5510:274-513(-)